MQVEALIDVYLSHLRVERGLSANTLSAYGADLARFAVFCADSGADSAGGVDLRMEPEDGMWPAHEKDFTGLVRASLRRTQDWTLPRFARALKHRQQMEEEVADLFEDVDVLLTPTTAVPAFLAEGPLPMEIGGRDASASGPVPFTMLANLCWNPAVSLPAGLNSEGLPVGLQVVSRRFADDVVLRLARIFEQTRPWSRHAPAATSGSAVAGA